MLASRRGGGEQHLVLYHFGQFTRDQAYPVGHKQEEIYGGTSRGSFLTNDPIKGGSEEAGQRVCGFVFRVALLERPTTTAVIRPVPLLSGLRLSFQDHRISQAVTECRRQTRLGTPRRDLLPSALKRVIQTSFTTACRPERAHPTPRKDTRRKVTKPREENKSWPRVMAREHQTQAKPTFQSGWPDINTPRCRPSPT